MAGVNKAILIGHLGSDPEVRTIESGTKVANFSIATTERYKDKSGNPVDKTEWHNIVMWRGLAEIAEKWLKKGSQVYIEGRLRTRSWDDKDGNKRYTTEILADNMTMLGGAGGSGSSSGGGQSQSAAPQQNQLNEPQGSSLDDIDDDLPF
ncbi:MAG: single-stranded DNA-binding protein [Flavobacteriales bacterium]|nr:single-stranded DNA-binding protein [Flavobacteriales bacterium]